MACCSRFATFHQHAKTCSERKGVGRGEMPRLEPGQFIRLSVACKVTDAGLKVPNSVIHGPSSVTVGHTVRDSAEELLTSPHVTRV